MAKFSHKSSGPKEAKEYEEEVIQIDRVTRVVAGGRRLRFRALVVIGNYKGKVGLGIGKSNEVTGAIKKAVRLAKRDLIKVPLYQETIPHEIKTKFKSAKVLLLPASPGTGLIAGGAVRKILELAGIKNILSKSFGSANRLNTAQATIVALSELRFRPEPPPKEAPKKPVEQAKPAEKRDLKSAAKPHHKPHHKSHPKPHKPILKAPKALEKVESKPTESKSEPKAEAKPAKPAETQPAEPPKPKDNPEPKPSK